MYDINKIETKICEIERNAMTGKELPAGYTQPEQLLFLSLRVLHWEYRHREITLEQARKEKERLAREYIQAARFQVIYQQAVEIRNRMGQYLTMANKGKCPICKKLVEIFEWREQDEQTQDKPNSHAEGAPGNLRHRDVQQGAERGPGAER